MRAFGKEEDLMQIRRYATRFGMRTLTRNEKGFRPSKQRRTVSQIPIKDIEILAQEMLQHQKTQAGILHLFGHFAVGRWHVSHYRFS